MSSTIDFQNNIGQTTKMREVIDFIADILISEREEI